MWSVLFCISLFALTACSSHTAENSNAQVHETATMVTDSAQEREANRLYSCNRGICKGSLQERPSRFDTLFLGKHADFPKIELPAKIENTNILLVMPEDGLTRMQNGNSLAFVNMVGDITEDSAEFVLVTFLGRARHQYDYFVDFKYNTERREFETVNSRFENYIYSKDGTLERIEIHKDDKHVGDKPIEDVNK